MDIRKLQRAIVDGLEDVKGQNIVVFNTEHLSPLFERVIIASGTSNRQTKALASSVRESVKAKGLSVLRTEGEENGEWIIVDCGAAVVHLMQPAIRNYYHLEELWGGKSVKMKFDGQATKLVKASPPPSGKASPARSVSAQQAAHPRAGRKPAGAGSATRKVVASKGAAHRAGAREAPVKKVIAKSPVANKPVAKKTAAHRAPVARKTTARKTVVRKVMAKRAAKKATSRA